MTDFAGDVPDQYDPHAVEERVFEYWDEVDAYERTKAHREDGEDFFFVDGPPYTSGAAHMGTTWNKALKDAYIRYLRMSGYNVTDRPGYDMHGLPIETKVEERLGFENKKDIEEFGEEQFIEECKAFADEQLEGLQSDFKSFGVWMDWEDPYKTVDPQYMEAAWWGFQRAHDRGLVERGKRSINQCPRCETGIANNEVEYEEVSDPSIYVKFPLREQAGYLVIWTTTPWTIPGNTFVAVDGEATYAAVEAENDGETEVLYVAEDLIEDALTEGRYDDYEVLETVDGEEMVGWTYDHPLATEVPDHPDDEGTRQVYTADYVEADRTGLVHSAPGHGEVDFERGKELGLEVFCPVAGDGVYTDEAGEYAGEYVRDANERIMADLDEKGLLLARGTVEHSYGHCWRCDTPVIQLATDQWFITITDIKDELLENIEDSDWYPEWARDNRFRDFVEEAPDWNVSRQRYWGIPIPIWIPEGSADSSVNGGGETAGGWSGDMDEAIVVGTREELAELVDQDIDPETVDLHKPTVDDLTITRDGTTYTRVEDVFDVWLDSSVASWGTIGFPEEDEDFEELWPADLIMEAHDQTRGWFWSQLGMGSAALGEVPYEQVLMHGYANMPDGRGMSKSKGILIDPHEVIEEHGRDPMRMFLLSATPQGEDMRFSWDGTETMQRDLNILWNAFRFPLPYMEMDGVEPDALDIEDGTATWTQPDGQVRETPLERVDRWLLSRLQAVVHDANEGWEDFEQHRALESVREFLVEDVSRYYIQVVRERMWDETATDSKLAAYATLVHALREAVVLLAPYAPFATEEIYQRLTGGEGHPTVHMCDWPEPRETLRDTALEQDVAILRDIEEAGSHARQQAGRKLRWPVTRVVVDTEDDRVVTALERHGDLLAERLNARRVELIDPAGTWGDLRYTATADMGVLGPEFGEDAQDIMNAINAAKVDERNLALFREAVEEELGEPVELTYDMIEFEEITPEDVAGSDFEGGTIYVDATLTDVVESEGYAREVIRRVQELRKDLDLDLDAEIALEIVVYDERVGELIAEREDLIASEVRARELRDVEDGLREQYEIEGVDVELTIAPAE
ncbi:isoleucine--tRNA ligase [Halanaeroarchaeum sulfurireducens]|uniref:Isoleucine--tRNA ligase n=1 Tax=Halanaeroarchaeum sulfurireducens TaxID=1604004 RepID=A0A0F7P8Z7_9EURY|nr:isoleucine--tRNA ligase [Halanaeroarchaeum sulfurireducens]AKH96655.1 isoleucyl-tRNA synthetase [Halanaeroarchaeum sulfurireducens]ALG81057.1 isoleucyl-tRNA synthetase [Halanaeroarchaeum sulfurireducens]